MGCGPIYGTCVLVHYNPTLNGVRKMYVLPIKETVRMEHGTGHGTALEAINHWPDDGVYLLFLECSMECSVKVGSVGVINFPVGHYCYVGRSKRHLHKRLERHLSPNKTKRWHIDYLTTHPNFAVTYVALCRPHMAEAEAEVDVAVALAQSFEVIKGLGSSDTGAKGHLFYSAKGFDMEIIKKDVCDRNIRHRF